MLTVYTIFIVHNSIKNSRGEHWIIFLTVHWPWNTCCDFTKLDFTVHHTHSLFLKHSLALHKPVKWVSGDRRCFQSPPTTFMPEPEYHNWQSSSSVFRTLMRVMSWSCVRRRKVRFCSFFKGTSILSLISELLDTYFQEIKEVFRFCFTGICTNVEIKWMVINSEWQLYCFRLHQVLNKINNASEVLNMCMAKNKQKKKKQQNLMQ